ncbi:MAG: helix-turn-helix transcriptional regulator [Cryobacterium sp.]
MRSACTAQGMSLAQVAQSTGLSKGFLGRVERDETSPGDSPLETGFTSGTERANQRSAKRSQNGVCPAAGGRSELRERSSSPFFDSLIARPNLYQAALSTPTAGSAARQLPKGGVRAGQGICTLRAWRVHTG